MSLRSYRIRVVLSFLLLVNVPCELHKSLTAPLDAVSKLEIPVGVILDMGSSFGQTVHSSFLMAISDFYSINHDYRTRLVLHPRDSRGEPLHALSVALDLMDNLKVKVIVGPETALEAKLLCVLGDRSKVPIISLTTNPSFISSAHCYFLPMTQDPSTQWKGLAAISESFKWKDVILINEDTKSARESVPYILNYFQEKNIHVSYQSEILPSATDDKISDELRKLLNLQQTVFIVHVSPSLAFRLLVYAKRMGLMNQGSAWIVTDKTMNIFDPKQLDREILESFQGVLGLRYHIPSSTQFGNFFKRWRKEYLFNNPGFNVLAYDAICAMAMAAERASETGTLVLEELLNVTFHGLSGEFHLVNRKPVSNPFEIVNVIGKSEKIVGFWTEDNGLNMYSSGLENVIWPGGSANPPRRQILQKSKKLRIAVPMLVGYEGLLSVVYDPQTKETIFSGFCIDVFEAAVKRLPYDVDYEFVPFTEAGNSQSYNELVYQVYLKNYDAAVGDITITAYRSSYVDFTSSFTDLGVGTVARHDNYRKMWWFFEPLDTRMWIAATCSFFIIGATIWLIEHPTNDQFKGPWQDVTGNVLWFSFSTLTFSHRAKALSNLSRLLVIVWLFIILIMVSCYNAALSSMLTVQQIQLSGRGIDIGYNAGSFIEGKILSNSIFKHPFLQPCNSLDDYAKELSRGAKKGGVVAIMDEFPYMKLFLAKYGNSYELVSYEPSTNGFGFAFPKRSPLVPDISRQISKLREDGELLRLEKKWFDRDSSFIPEDSQAVHITILTLHNFRGLFLVGAIFLALVPFVFLMRFIYGYLFLICNFLIDFDLELESLELS